MVANTVESTLELSPTSVSLAWDGSGSAVVNVTSNTTWDVVTL